MKFFEETLTSRAEVGGGTLSQPAAWVIDSLGGGKTKAGTRINEFTAEGIPVVYTCTRILAETVGQLPLKVYERTSNGKRVAQEHPLYPILHDQANPYMTAYDFRDTMQQIVSVWGNSYAEIQRDTSGRVVALWPLLPGRMWVDWDASGRLRYRYDLEQGSYSEWIWNPDLPQILHLRINALDGIHGRSPIRVLRESLGLTKAVEEFGARFFGNNAVPGLALKSEKALTPKARQNIAESWNQKFSGLENQHRLAILHSGVTLEKIGIPPDDGQFIETRVFQLEDGLRIWRIPPHMVGHTSKATSWGTGLEQNTLGFVNFTMMPWFVRWQQEIRRSVLMQDERDRYEALFVINALVRGDIKTRYEAYRIGRNLGSLNANEIRDAEDMNRIEGDAGEMYWRPVNVEPMAHGLPVVWEAERPTGPVN